MGECNRSVDARDGRTSGRRFVYSLVIGTGVGLVAVTSVVLPVSAQTTDLCSRFGTPTATGAVASADLLEISGLVASGVHDDVLWAVNDRGGGPIVHALSLDGADLGPYRVPGVRVVDWEDIAVGPGSADGTTALYVGDIGDDRGTRDTVSIVRVAEPDASPDGNGGNLAAPEVFRIRYADGPGNAEALLVDPDTGDVVIVRSEADGTASVHEVARRDLTTDGVIEARAVGALALAPGTSPLTDGITAGDVTRDGELVLLRTVDGVLAYGRDGGSLADALTSEPCAAPAADEPAPQSLAILPDGSAFVTATEVAGAIGRGELPPGSASPLNTVEIAAAATPPVTTEPSTAPDTVVPDTAPPDTAAPDTAAPDTAAPDTAAPDTAAAAAAPDTTLTPGGTAPSTVDSSSDDEGGLPVALIAVGVGVVLALLALLLVIRRRRSRPLPGSAPLSDPPAATVTPPVSSSASGSAPTSPLPPPAAGPATLPPPSFPPPSAGPGDPNPG